MAITREFWISELIEAAKAIADEKTQTERWLAPDARAWERPEELMCTLIDDLQLDLFIQEYGATFSTEQKVAVTGFRDAVDQFNEGTPAFLDAKKVLADPRWRVIRSKAHTFDTAFRNGNE